MPLVLAFVALALTAPIAAAQGERASGAYVGIDHWSRTAIHRLAGLGLTDAAHASLAWPIRLSRVRRIFMRAADDADPEAAARIAAWIQLLDEERGERIAGLPLAGRLDIGYNSRAGNRIGGALTPRAGGDFDYTGSLPAPDVHRIDAAFAVDISASPLTIAAERVLEGDARGRTQALYALAGGRMFEIWGGRRPLALGPSTRGIVLGSANRVVGLGIELPDGFRLPAFLDALGDVRLSQTLGVLERSGPIDLPWFLSTRLSFAPSRSLAIGLNRAAIFGGSGNQDVTIERIFWMLLGQTDIGSKDSDFENQVASVDFLWQTGWNGLTLFGEYGFDDAGPAFLRVPGITIGARLARIPGAPALSPSLEITHLASHCCGHPPWYQHGILAEGWSDLGVLIGHPVGGEGSQMTLAVRGDVAASQLIADARFRVTHRGPENLLAPALEGTAIGADLYAMARIHSHVRLVINLSGDRFRGGRTRHDAWLGIRAVF